MLKIIDSDFSDEEVSHYLEYERRTYTVRPRSDYFNVLMTWNSWLDFEADHNVCVGLCWYNQVKN